MPLGPNGAFLAYSIWTTSVCCDCFSNMLADLKNMCHGCLVNRAVGVSVGVLSRQVLGHQRSADGDQRVIRAHAYQQVCKGEFRLHRLLDGRVGAR